MKAHRARLADPTKILTRRELAIVLRDLHRKAKRSPRIPCHRLCCSMGILNGKDVVMRRSFSLALICGLLGVGYGDEPRLDVFCPAAMFDDNRDAYSGPEGPNPVVLIVVAKTTQPFARSKESSEPRSGQEVELAIERVLFGSPPGKVLNLGTGGGGSVPENSDQVSHIYSIALDSRYAVFRSDNSECAADRYFTRRLSSGRSRQESGNNDLGNRRVREPTKG